MGKGIECCVDGELQQNDREWRIFSYDLYRNLRDRTPGIDGRAAVQAGIITTSARRKGEPRARRIDTYMLDLLARNTLSIRYSHLI